MTVKQLKMRLEKMPDDMPVIIEAENGRKFTLLTAKKRTLRAGHGDTGYCWLCIGEYVDSPLSILTSK